MQKLKRAYQVEPSAVQVLSYNAQALLEVLTASDIEERSESDQNLDPLDKQVVA